MFKISKMSDYATVLLAQMARENLHCMGEASAAQLSERAQLPAPTVAKLLKQLQKAELVRSVRGAAGGYHLARAPEAITVTQILEAMEGPLSITECGNAGALNCQRLHFCSTRGHWSRINSAIRDALDAVTLAELAKNNSPIRAQHSPHTSAATATAQKTQVVSL